MLIGSLRSIECNFAERQVGQALQSINSVASSQLKVNRCEHYDQNQKLGMQGAVHVCARYGYSSMIVGFATMPVKSFLTIHDQIYL